MATEATSVNSLLGFCSNTKRIKCTPFCHWILPHRNLSFCAQAAIKGFNNNSNNNNNTTTIITIKIQVRLAEWRKAALPAALRYYFFSNYSHGDKELIIGISMQPRKLARHRYTFNLFSFWFGAEKPLFLLWECLLQVVVKTAKSLIRGLVLLNISPLGHPSEEKLEKLPESRP